VEKIEGDFSEKEIRGGAEGFKTVAKEGDGKFMRHSFLSGSLQQYSSVLELSPATHHCTSIISYSI
jgi:hypothetical protein